MRKTVVDHYSKGDPTSTLSVDESKRPLNARNLLKEYKDYDASIMGASGTYVKIQDDIWALRVHFRIIKFWSYLFVLSSNPQAKN